MKKAASYLGAIGALILFIGLLMKLMHWSFADQFILIGGIVFAIFLIPRLMIKMYPKQSK